MLISPVDGIRLVKRVIGVPGDTIVLSQNRLLINGQTIDYEPASNDYHATIAEQLRPHSAFAEEQLPGHPHAVMGLALIDATHRNFEPVTVPPDQFFILGDSRDNSLDSRAWGFAPPDAILGLAKGVLGSLDINDTYLPRWNRWSTRLR